MRKYLPLLAVLSLGFASCAGPKANYKTNYAAPTTAGVSSSISNSKEKVTSAQTHAKKQGESSAKIAERVAAAAAKAKSASDRLIVIAKATEATPEVHTLVLQVQADVDFLTQELLGVKTENEALANENKALIIDLGDTSHALVAAEAALAQVKAAVQTQTKTLNDVSKTLNEQIVQNKIDRDNYHKLKAFIIGAAMLVVGAVLFGLFGVKAFLPPLLWITLAAPAVVGTFLFFYLGTG